MHLDLRYRWSFYKVIVLDGFGSKDGLLFECLVWGFDQASRVPSASPVMKIRSRATSQYSAADLSWIEWLTRKDLGRGFELMPRSMYQWPSVSSPHSSKASICLEVGLL